MIDILRGVKNPMRLFLCLALPCALAGTACAQTFGNTAVVVNGHRISQSQLQAEIPVVKAGQPTIADDEAQRQALIATIENELLRQVAVQKHIVPTVKQINDRMDALRANLGSSFEQQVKAAGYTDATLKSDFIFNNLVVNSLQAQLAPPVTQDQVLTVYKAQKQQFRQIMIEQILFVPGSTKTAAQALAQAKSAVAQLKSGTDFSALAKKLSDDPSAKTTGGKIAQWVTVSDQNLSQSFPLDSTVAEAAYAAPIGKVTGPVQSAFAYHVFVTLDKRIEPLTAALSTQIRQSLESQVGQRAIADFVASLVKKAKILVNPRYGDWNPATQSIVAHQFFRPAPGESPTETLAPQLSGLPTPTP